MIITVQPWKPHQRVPNTCQHCVFRSICADPAELLWSASLFIWRQKNKILNKSSPGQRSQTIDVVRTAFFFLFILHRGKVTGCFIRYSSTNCDFWKFKRVKTRILIKGKGRENQHMKNLKRIWSQKNLQGLKSFLEYCVRLLTLWLTDKYWFMINLDLFRRDQIWFTEIKSADRSTDLFSLTEIKNVRKDENFGKGYIAGKYGWG